MKIYNLIGRHAKLFNPDGINRFCSGEKSLCNELKREDGYGILPWEGKIKPSLAKQVDLVDLMATKQAVKIGKPPEFLKQLSNLKILTIEFPLLREMNYLDIPQSVESMIVARNINNDRIVEKVLLEPLIWPQDIVHKRLKAIKFISDYETSSLLQSLNSKLLPGLRFLEFAVTEEADLNVLRNFSKLTDVTIRSFSDHKVFDFLEANPITGLDLSGSNAKFDLTKIIKLSKLQSLRMNGVRSEIDCKIFSKLKHLNELNMLNCPKIKNVEALLKLPSLQSLEILSCKGSLDSKTKEKLRLKGFKVLEIDYA